MKNTLAVKNMKICSHAIRILEKNSSPSFKTKEPPSPIKPIVTVTEPTVTPID